MTEHMVKVENAWKVAAFSPRTKWLVTSPNGVWRLVADERCWVPYSLAHAREVGAFQTACGEYAVGWELFWRLPFDAVRPGVCKSCAELVRRNA